MKKISWIGYLLAISFLFSCVTIHIYFPAEEVRSAADRFVHEVWGERNARPADEPSVTEPVPGPGARLRFGGASTAWAAQNIDVSTPEIRAIKEAMQRRHESLQPLLESGRIGIDAAGLLAVRDLAGLDLRSRSQAQRLVEEENADRLRLYREIARANDFPDRAGEVQSIFADSWRDQAPSGWYLQDRSGAWRRK